MDEDAVISLLTEMVRAGVIPEDIVHAAADECEARDQDMSAHRLRCLIVEACATPAAERAKAERRAGIRLVSDGGNES